MKILKIDFWSRSEAARGRELRQKKKKWPLFSAFKSSKLDFYSSLIFGLWLSFKSKFKIQHFTKFGHCIFTQDFKLAVLVVQKHVLSGPQLNIIKREGVKILNIKKFWFGYLLLDFGGSVPTSQNYLAIGPQLNIKRGTKIRNFTKSWTLVSLCWISKVKFQL